MTRLLIALPLVALLAGPAQAAAPSLEDQLVTLEKQSWVAWQGHDGAFFERFLSGDHVEMQPNGEGSKAGVIAGVKAGCTVKSYAVDHFKLTQFSVDTALLTYRAQQDTTCGGSPVPSPVWATSLFVRRDGQWQNVLYAHVPAQK
jgi:hypothetical protein